MHKYIPLVFLALLPLFLSAQNKPPRRIKLPAQLNEASGLVYISRDSLWWHNDSGDGPVLYLTDIEGRLRRTDTLFAARAIDWEDMTTDGAGTFYIGDFGNNLGRRPSLQIYRYRPGTGAVDSIIFRYPGQDGRGRDYPGNFDTEGFFFLRDTLHLFTKDQLPRSEFVTKHFVIPAKPGNYVAELRDSLRLRRRVVTAAAIDQASGEVVFTSYYYRFFLGFIPYSAASLYLATEYPNGYFLRGRLRRKGLACFIPTQYEAVDFGPPGYIYAASERTIVRRAKAKRIRRRQVDKETQLEPPRP